MSRTISILVTGKVQGVFYRKSAREKAIELGLTGKVRNLTDGSVHIIASGESTQLDAFISWCKLGPSRAAVKEIMLEELSPVSFSSFIIER